MVEVIVNHYNIFFFFSFLKQEEVYSNANQSQKQIHCNIFLIVTKNFGNREKLNFQRYA
jgi:hypothetical protein